MSRTGEDELCLCPQPSVSGRLARVEMIRLLRALCKDVTCTGARRGGMSRIEVSRGGAEPSVERGAETIDCRKGVCARQCSRGQS
jgi:hypothetical protein